MKNYIKKVEALVNQKLKEEPKKKKKVSNKGFMSRPNENTNITMEEKDPIDLMTLVVEQIVYIRKKRMELKQNA
tara:strand:- start:485 stop:706 length:222 start_codon:yes stop_codon:yes gene_type:complete